MRLKFKIGDTVIVNGIGKEDDKRYIDEYGTVVEKDDSFLDFKVRFSNKRADWFDEKYLRYPKKYKGRNKKQ